MDPFVLKGLDLQGQRVIDDGILSRLFSVNQLFALLALFTPPSNGAPGMHDGIGIPNILTRQKIAPARQAEILGLASWDKVLHTQYTNGSKVMGMIDTNPVEPDDNNSPDFHFGTARFRMYEHRMPVQVSQVLLDANTSGKSGTNKGAAWKNTFSNAVDEKMSVLVDQELSPRLWNGTVSDQGASRWNGIIGIQTICKSTGLYGNVDRSDPACPDVWKGTTVTNAQPASFADLILRTKFNRDGSNTGIAAFGDDVDVVITSMPLFLSAYKELLAAGAQRLNQSMPQAATYGISSDALLFGNTVITYDPKIPNVKWAFVGSLKSLIVVFNPNYKFKKTPWVNQAETEKTGKNIWWCNIIVQFLLACDNPAVNTLYTNITATN